MTYKKTNGCFRETSFPNPDKWSFKGERLHDIQEVRAKLQPLCAEMLRWGFHYMEIFCARYAIGEALVNAIKHGNQSDKTKTVQLNYMISPDYILAEVIDEGPGFDHRSIPNPFELRQSGSNARGGLFLMNLFMTWVRFEGRGNRVTLCKMRSLDSTISA
jgi:anti-sigma regulatory factor (Ser/Thr protein kinase)